MAKNSCSAVAQAQNGAPGRRAGRGRWMLAFSAAVLSCSGTDGQGSATGASGGSGGAGNASAGGAEVTPLGGPSSPSGACQVVTQAYAVHSAQHVPDCSALPEWTSPPCGGDHYPTWAAFQTFDFTLPHGFVIHSMEHGAIVLFYNCPQGCADEVSQAQAFIDGLPVDPFCAGTAADRRVVMLPDPSIGARWAASAWGFTLRASCFDAAAMTAFYNEHYAHGPEDMCASGEAFTSAPCR